MVSFWPFKGGDSSAASFEKVLSHLSTKINKLSAQNDTFRQKQRRYKVLSTLYLTFAYILVAAILTLVTGYQRWSAVEYSAIAGGPVLIYAVRTGLEAYYNYRITNSQNHLNELYKQREVAIGKLKAATKYDSTQQLLDKYGGSQGKSQTSPQPTRKRKPEVPQGKQSAPQGPRTGFAPPPTANIPRSPTGPPRPPEDAQSAPPPNMQAMQRSQPPYDERTRPNSSMGPNEEFAPNAFSAPSRPPTLRQASQQYSEGPKWYDRIMDVVLGEDETQAKNRIVLICNECRLVNGQAPPGAKSLEDVGKWRCSSCHALNGVESEEKRMLRQVSEAAGNSESPISPHVPTSAVSERGARGGASQDKSEVYEHVDEEEAEDADTDADESEISEANERSRSVMESSPAASTRSKARQRKKA